MRDSRTPDPLPTQIALRMITRGLWDRVAHVPYLDPSSVRAITALAVIEVIEGVRGRDPDERADLDGLDVWTHRMPPVDDERPGYVIALALDDRHVCEAVVTSPDGGVFSFSDFVDDDPISFFGKWY